MTTEKEIYVEPEMELIEFDAEDIIRTSGDVGEEEGDEW